MADPQELARVEGLLAQACHILKRNMGRDERPLYTIESVYGQQPGKISPTPGYRFSRDGFRVPVEDEIWMRPDGMVSQCRGGMTEPRLILERIPKKRLVFDVIDEGRVPGAFEWTWEGGRSSVCRLSPVVNWTAPCKYVLSEPRLEEE